MRLKMYFLKYIDENGSHYRMPFFFANDHQAKKFCKLNHMILVRELDPNNFNFEEPVADSNGYEDDSLDY